MTNFDNKAYNSKLTFWQGTKLVCRFIYEGIKFIIKNTPKFLGLVWQVKKTVATQIDQNLHEINQELKKSYLEMQINSIKKEKEQNKAY